MSTGRKAEMQKKEAVTNKAKADDYAMYQAAMNREKNAEFEETEEVKAMRMWAKIWGNSIESTMVNAVKPMLKEVVREVVREELVYMVKGLGLGEPSPMHDVVKKEMRSALQEAAAMIAPRVLDESAALPEDEDTTNVSFRNRGASTVHTPERIAHLVVEAYKEIGLDVIKVNKFKAIGPQFNGAYQSYNRMMRKEGKAYLGSWRDYTKAILEENDLLGEEQ